jgi:hypothetical protein
MQNYTIVRDFQIAVTGFKDRFVGLGSELILRMLFNQKDQLTFNFSVATPCAPAFTRRK